MSSAVTTDSECRAIDTSKVAGRRQLHFQSLDDILAEAQRISAGPVRCLGNWTAGSAMSHVARTMKMSLDGAEFRAPIYIRVFARIFKNRWLTNAMPPGFKLPASAAQELIPLQPVSTDAGLVELQTMVGRLKCEPQRAPSPVFGPMTIDDWNRLHCRHAELHFSFIVPE